jgi:hypothetical protein
MRRHIRRHGIGVLSIGLVALPVLAQDTEITSVRFRVEPTTAALSIAIENLRDSALVAWRIELVPGGATESNFIGSLFPWSPGQGPVAPHETRIEPFRAITIAGTSEARAAAAIFADGYYQGSGPALDRFFAGVKERTADLTYWIDVFNKVPDASSKEATDYLLAKIAEPAGQSPSDPLEIRSNLLGRVQGPRPDWWVPRTVQDYQRDLAAALRNARVPLVAAPAGAPPSLAVRTVPSTSTDYTAYIENLRDTRIEAWVIDTDRSPDGRSRGKQSWDACIGDPALELAANLRGRIRPHEVREEFIPMSSRAEPSQIRLAMVLFEDLSFEGSTEDRDLVLKERERQADEAAYWSQAFKEAAALPGDQVKAYLQAKRTERAAQNAAAGRGVTTHEVDDALAALERSPQTISSWLSARQATLEGQRARLSRHVTG